MKRYVSASTTVNYKGIEFDPDEAVGMKLGAWLKYTGLDADNIEILNMPHVIYQHEDILANFSSVITHPPVYDRSISPCIQVKVSPTNYA